uniref:Uncharacterized protein n=1 Tax=Knope narna-like virus TaxID=2716645 RepID=A0A6G7PSM6_9VIRU|nr:hypothetical protein [Knope narna-like virus]
MSNLPDPRALAKAQASSAQAINATLAATNPSSATAKRNTSQPQARQSQISDSPKAKSNRSRTSGTRSLQQVADDLRTQLASAREAEARRKEFTPTISVGDESLTLDYVGKVAGKSVVRQDPFATAKRMSLLRPLLQPIISVANGALKGMDFTAPMRFSDEKLKAYTKASPLDKASYAYETLFANPDFVRKLSELNEVIERTFQTSGMQPKDVYAVSRDETGHRKLSAKERLDMLTKPGLNVTSVESQDDKGITPLD